MYFPNSERQVDSLSTDRFTTRIKKALMKVNAFSV